MSASASTGSWRVEPEHHQQWYIDVPEDAQWGRAEEAAWPGQLIETTTTNCTNPSTTNMRGEPTNRSTIANMRGKWRHKPRWPQQKAPPKHNKEFRVTSFRRQDLLRKETSNERALRRAGIRVEHFVPATAFPFFLGQQPDLELA